MRQGYMLCVLPKQNDLFKLLFLAMLRSSRGPHISLLYHSITTVFHRLPHRCMESYYEDNCIF